MTDDSMLAGFDPFNALDQEAERLDTFFSSLPWASWSTPSRCPGWTTRDILAHLVAGELYYRACLDGRVSEFMAEMAAKGGTDLDSINQVSIDQLADRAPDELLTMWRAANLENRQEFRERRGAKVQTPVGEYPCSWGAVHLASELATHADDFGVPVAADEGEPRRAWRRAASWFALVEAKPEVTVSGTADGRMRISDATGVTVDVDSDELIEGVMGRLDLSSRLTADQRALLAASPAVGDRPEAGYGG